MSNKQSIYITTAISYPNGSPHLGHAYEVVSADILARYHKLAGRNVYFLTGTDEHGQKIAKTAELMNLTPKRLCDQNTQRFKDLDEALRISYDYFIRTTDPFHHTIVHHIFDTVYEKGDIYLGHYQGWYNPREERFVTETEAASTHYLDPMSNKKYEWVTEESYFFRLEPYRAQLIDYISCHENFIPSEDHRKNILHRLEESLLDLSISRTSFDWGISLQEKYQSTDKKHVLYVWFDALINYLSGLAMINPIDFFAGNYWGNYGSPIHIIGHDILWFHAVTWPCILLSAGIPLPSTIIVHGFINDATGKKMSKSLGNVIDPNDLLEKYPSDVLRYYFIRAGSYGSDIKFSESQLIDKNNSELADNYGNLVNRAFGLAERYCQSMVPTDLFDEDVIDLCLLQQIDELFLQGLLSSALDLIIQQVQLTNQWLSQKAPWKSTCTNQNGIIRCLLEKVYIITHLLLPFLPDACSEVLRRFQCKSLTLNQITKYNLQSASPLDCSKLILFKKI